MSVVLRKATAIDSKRERKADILLENGIISGIGERLEGPFGTEIDCGGLTLLPSFVDLHAHFRDPGLTHKEDIRSGCRAAVHGGYTFVNLMPNTKPVCSSMETVRYVREKAADPDICDIHQTVSITKDFDGRTLSHLEGLDGSVKWLSDDGYGVDSTHTMLAAMRWAKDHGVGLMLHEEDGALSKTDAYLAEELQTFRDVELAVLTGCRVHFCHVSTIRALDFILEGKRSCRNITYEVSPHHLALNDAEAGRVAPPLRAEEHRRYLLDRVAAGCVDALATDHAPHTREEKAAGANGFTGLDLSFATLYTTLVRSGLVTMHGLSRMLSYTPGGLMGLPPALIEEGAPANLVLVETETAFTAGEEHIHSKSKNSPMLGRELYGTVLMTIKGGKIVYDGR